MATPENAVLHPGDPRHPEHEAFLLELGRATFAAAHVANIAFNILRVLDGEASAAMYSDPLGRLNIRVRELAERQPTLPRLTEFAELLDASVQDRNDLLHALPVRDGLYRRTSKDLRYVRTFYTVDDLRKVTQQLEFTRRVGSAVLYHDGGAAVRAWYERGGT